MTSLIVDTHTIIWYLSGNLKLSEKAKKTIDNALDNDQLIYLSSITIVELVYLVEKNRLPIEALTRLLEVIKDTDMGIIVIDLNLSIIEEMRTIPRSIVPDMPDRIIAATASYLKCPLITADHKIQAADIETIW
jgi:PIN domain nuclease of toxin-antitoxin system